MKVLGWVQVDEKEVVGLMREWSLPRERITAQLAWMKATGMALQGGMDWDFQWASHTIRLSTQVHNRDLLVAEGEVSLADIHILAYLNNLSVLFLGWQWGKVLAKRKPRGVWYAADRRVKYYVSSVTGLRKMGDLLKQVVPERMEVTGEQRRLM